MSKMLFSLCMLLASFPMMGQQSMSGIRIDGGNTPIIVYIDGNQMNYPSTSCFVAALRPNKYTIEIYAAYPARPGERVRQGKLLLSERIYYTGNKVIDFFVDERKNAHHNRPDDGDYRVNPDYRYSTMDNELFEKFYDLVKKEPFADARIKIIETALTHSDFTSNQCLQIVKLCSFDDEKMKIMKLMYPRIVDKQAFFTVIDALVFSSSKKSITAFVKQYSER